MVLRRAHASAMLEADRHSARKEVEQDVLRVEDADGQKPLDALVERAKRRSCHNGEQWRQRDAAPLARAFAQSAA